MSMATCFLVPERYRDVWAEARAIASEITPLAAEADASSTIHQGVHAALVRSGLCGLTVPARYGGRYADVDPVAVCLAREAFMSVSAHLDALFSLQGIGSLAIAQAGSEAQRDTWLPRVATGGALAALALTEPHVGSDLRNISTEVVEDDGELVLTGHKSFISNAGAAAFYTVLVRDDEATSLVLVPADLPGVSPTPGPQLSPPHVVGDVRFRDVRLPSSARIGPPGDGIRLVLATLATFRVSVGAAAVGLAQAALDEAVRHTTTRNQFGRPLARLGAVAGMLADSWTEIEMARLLTYRAAELAREHPGGETLHYSSMAKLAATEAADRVVDRTVQMMGRFGLIADSKIDRLYRGARPMRIYEGASEILRLGIARGLTEEGS
jgi:acyl-CoA dehydrogenase